MSTTFTGVVDQCEYKAIIFKIDLIFPFLIRTAMFFSILVHYRECITCDHTAHPDNNLSIAICYKTGVGLNMESNGVINRSVQVSFPIPVIDRLCLKMRQGRSKKNNANK